MAIMAGLGILLAGVVVIATRYRAKEPADAPVFEPVRIAAELIRLRIDGSDSGARRRALKTAAGQLPDSPFARALAAFADGNLEAAAREPAATPFADGLRGWILVELGRRPEAAQALRAALDKSPIDWEFRPLFEAALAKAT